MTSSKDQIEAPANGDGEGKSASKSDASNEDSGAYLRIFKYSDALSGALTGSAFVAAIGAGVILPLMDLIFGKFITTFTRFALEIISPAQFRSEINKYTLYFVYLFIAKFCLVYFYSVAISVSAIRTTKALRIDFLKHTLRQDISYFDAAQGGSVTEQVTTSCNNVNNGISEKLALTVQGVSTFVSAFVIAFAVQWKLTLITISIVPTILIVTAVSITYDMKLENKMLSIYSKAGLLAEEVFSTMRTVHSFWLHPLLSQKYDSLLSEAMDVGFKKSPNYSILFSIEFFCVYSGYGLAFWQGIRMYTSGEISESGDVFTVIMAVIVAAVAMTSIAPSILFLTKASSAASQLFKTIDRPSEIDPLSGDGKRPKECVGNIELRNLHFEYPSRPDVKVLNGLTLSIPAGKSTALVGSSGSGKSTVIGLLERWYDPSGGALLLDGIDVRELNIKWLRTHLRLVQQEPVLFSGTVFDNVAYGLYGTEKAELPEKDRRALVEKACEAAYADEFIERLPKGYDTKVGERGIMISGGQKQRLAIARSIVSDPRVLLLDEATSALDPRAENIVQKALDNVSANRTTIVIAHRLSTIRNADNIAVMTNGAVVEQGTHDVLLDADGAYARLVKAQDLGQGREKSDGDSREGLEDDGVGDEKTDENLVLARTATQATSFHDTDDTKNSGDGINYNLLICVWIITKEQGHLWKWLIVMGIATLLGGLTFPAQAIVFARIVRAFELTGSEARSEGNFFSLMFFVIALGNLVVFAVIGWTSNILAQHVSRKYRREIFDLILKQDMSFFDREENATGSLATKLSGYPSNLLELMGFNIMLILINIVNVVSSAILALIVGWKLGLVVVFGALPPLLFSGWLRIRLEFKLEDATSRRFSSSAALAAEAVSAIRTVASLAIEEYILKQYQERLQGVAVRSIKALVWTMFWYSLTQSINFLAMALGFWYGGRLISFGEYSTTQLFIVFIGVIFSGEAAASFFSYTTSMTKAQTAANYIFWLRRIAPVVRENSAKPPHDKEGDGHGATHVTCEDLAFAYESRPKANVLDGINVDVQPGQFIAFVGASGCGKSTMIALLERFYDPTRGRITSDGTALADICPRKYRRTVSLVQQEPVLYQGSVRDNIAMGLDKDATNAQIEEAARQSNIYEFVSSLPEGFNTFCGSRGTQLSGGQRQRIAIARALIRQPRLLLLDEATSALDTESERVVQAALEKVKSGRTTIAVAHRLSTIKDADCIFVFAKGRILESGTHTQLLNKKGMYYEMCLGQGMDRSVSG